jgi:hypothetical protein
MNKPSTWLALIVAAAYVGAYWYAKQDFDAQYQACVKDRPSLEKHCLCQRDAMLDEVTIYRIITAYSSEMKRVKSFAGAACVRVKG